LVAWSNFPDCERPRAEATAIVTGPRLGAGETTIAGLDVGGAAVEGPAGDDGCGGFEIVVGGAAEGLGVLVQAARRRAARRVAPRYRRDRRQALARGPSQAVGFIA